MSSVAAGGAVFHWADYVVFSATLLMSFAVGVYYHLKGHGGAQATTQGYLMGNRQLALLPTTISMVMSYTSAIFVLASSAEMYLHGSQYWVAFAGNATALLVSTVLYVPLIWPLRITSNYQYHELRYKSRLVRLSNTVMDLLWSLMYMGMATYAPAIALEAVTGLPMWVSILCIAGLATVYTTIGGIRAVVWTDFFQGFVLIGGMMAVVIMGTAKVGGMSEVWRINREHGRIRFFDFNPDPTVRLTFWSAFFGGFLTGMTTVASTQYYIQRYVALPTLTKAKLSLFLQLPVNAVVSFLGNFGGLTVFAYYASVGCDPLRGGQITSANQILPYFVVDVLGHYPGLPGLFVAVLFAGALSSVSTSMNGMSAITWKDFLEPVLPTTKLSEARRTLITKLLAFTYGAGGLGTAFLMAVLTGHIGQITDSVLGAFGGPMAGVVFLGTMFPCAQWKGATAGMLSGLSLGAWINYGQQVYKPWPAHLPTDTTNCSLPANWTVPDIPTNPTDVFPLYRVSYMYISSIGWVVTVAVGLVVSLVTGRSRPEDVDPRTIVPLPDRCCCCWVLPARYTSVCYCGVDHTSPPPPPGEEEDKCKYVNVVEDMVMKRTSDEDVKNGDIFKGE